MSGIRVIKIADTLYRIVHDRKIKDVWVKNDKIQEPNNDIDILTDEEKKAVQIEIDNNTKRRKNKKR